MTHFLHEAVNQSGLIMQLMNIIKDYEMHHQKGYAFVVDYQKYLKKALTLYIYIYVIY